MSVLELAELVKADALVILTAVERVCINWGKPNQESLDHMSLADAAKYCEEGHFAPGSMLPKVQAAMNFAASKDGNGVYYPTEVNVDNLALYAFPTAKFVFKDAE